MATHNQLGKEGENIAASYLAQRGYTILFKNWRYSHYEIDIIATRKNKLHFIEVKTRSSSYYGYPEESVTKRKFKFLQQAADEFLYHNPQYKWIQYDILSIIHVNNKLPEFFLLEDVFL
ncbi:hypothetical protein A8C56_15410 [Niabella ginsenosidivorans]|uniref:UPF0102 protein A8C56_15410 n=1 Tax=Niabella ginsenosidivorans TaxID=1176587 RepID=A0A1A9I634_9BACT|nr:YraN family protein [Niabella ginsenosidivorans]ANH82170.1 hypothetical protein A8C56_15410 [Niabella ginsenosidivorans]